MKKKEFDNQLEFGHQRGRRQCRQGRGKRQRLEKGGRYGEQGLHRESILSKPNEMHF